MTLTVLHRLFQRRYALDVVLVILIACGLSLSWTWVVMCVLAPLCEELIFRWGLQEGFLLRGCRHWQANVATALIFAIAHGLFRSWALAPWVVLPALFLGWVYQQGRAQGARGAVWRCILWHSAFNTIYLMFKN